MLEFQFQKCTRQCHESGREFNSGEEFYSVLIAVGGEVVRRDFSCEHWTEPPGDAIGWWKSEMPEQTSKTANLAPNDVLIQFFQPHDVRVPRETHHRHLHPQSVSHTAGSAGRAHALDREHVPRRTFLGRKYIGKLASP